MPAIGVSRERITLACDVLAVPIYRDGRPGSGAADVERALGTSVKDLLSQSRMKGDVGEVLTVPTLGKLGAKQVMFVGLGEQRKADTTAARKAGATVARRTSQSESVATTIPQAVKGGAGAAVEAFVEGYLLGAYRFDRYRTNGEERAPKTKRLDLLSGRGWDARKAAEAVKRAQILAESTALARDLTNVPAGDQVPQTLAEEARKLAKGNGLALKVFTEKELRAGGFGGILGVGSGSSHPPRMIVLRYEPPGAKRTIALVGKGITYDSGGLNLKTSGLDWMKMDMAGGAAVIGAMSAIARLKPKGVAVWGIVCSAENMPGPDAVHPGDVLKMYGGKTVEVGDTDAEGRVVMADGIAWAAEQGADVIADIATLTGACVMALGNKTFGVMGAPASEVRKVVDAATRAGESAWELPLNPDYRKSLDSEIADLRNISGRGVGAGAITAALFLKEFAGDTPWVHLDIAGPARSEADEFEIPKGGTGVGVRTLVEWVLSR